MPRQELKVTVSSTDYNFNILPKETGGKVYQLQSREWQPGDSQQTWRVPLHDWTEGLGPDRFQGRRTYAKANADASNPGILVPPPAQTAETVGIGRSYEFSDETVFEYGRSAYGVIPYLGPVTFTPFDHVASLNERTYFGGNNKLYEMNALKVVSLLKTFGVTDQISALEAFQGKIYIGLGPSIKMQEFNPLDNSFTEATDNTFAIALGTVDNKMWRAEDPNLLSNCITAPLTLSSWVPAASNQYEVGDTNYPVINILDYGGVPWVEKRDGIYAPDSKAEFHNQTPQLKQAPRIDTQLTMFTAWGFLWSSSSSGMLRISPGESLPIGPELTERPDYVFHGHGGVQYGKDVYLLVHDHSEVEETAIIKMTRTDEENFYVFHEIARSGAVENAGFITVVTHPVNPQVVYSVDSGLKLFALGRSGARHINDPNYAFDTTMVLETGRVQPTRDMSVVNMLVGTEIVLDADSSESFTLDYKIEDGSYTNLLNTQEGGGSAAITNTSGYASIVRYAAPDTNGQFFQFRLTGTQDAGTGSDRPEIREWWAFGYSHPKTTDMISLAIYGSGNARVQGIPQGMNTAEVLRLFREWKDLGTILTVELDDYEESRTVRFRLVDVSEQDIVVDELGSGTQRETAVNITLMRIDYANAYADA